MYNCSDAYFRWEKTRDDWLVGTAIVLG